MIAKSKTKAAAAAKPADEEDPVRRIAYDIEPALAELKSGIQVLFLMSEAMAENESRAVDFVAQGLKQAHARVYGQWQSLCKLVKVGG